MGFGSVNGSEPCNFTGFCEIHGPKPYILASFGDIHRPLQNPRVPTRYRTQTNQRKPSQNLPRTFPNPLVGWFRGVLGGWEGFRVLVPLRFQSATPPNPPRFLLGDPPQRPPETPQIPPETPCHPPETPRGRGSWELQPPKSSHDPVPSIQKPIRSGRVPEFLSL